APIGTTVVSRHFDTAAQAGRRKYALIAPILQEFTHARLIGFGDIRVDVLFSESLTGKRRRSGGKGLRGRSEFAGHVGLRDRSLFDRPQRLAGDTIEHE